MVYPPIPLSLPHPSFTPMLPSVLIACRLSFQLCQRLLFYCFNHYFLPRAPDEMQLCDVKAYPVICGSFKENAAMFPGCGEKKKKKKEIGEGGGNRRNIEAPPSLCAQSKKGGGGMDIRLRQNCELMKKKKCSMPVNVLMRG